MNAPTHLQISRYKSEEILQSAQAINALSELVEKLRAHVSGEIKLEPEDITELAKSGFVMSGVTKAIDILSMSISKEMERVLLNNKGPD